MIQIIPNSNFYSLSGSVHDNSKSEIYKEYRRAWLEYPANFFLRDFPMHLDIEITSRCNLRCTFCDKLPLLDKGNLGDMDIKLYRKIIDEGTKYQLWSVKLSYRGEPLLHKNVVEMVAYAKEKGILDVYFNTNGTLLNDEMCEKLIEAGLDRVSVSIEGIEPVPFEKERIGAKFDVILRNINTLLKLRNKKGVDYPKLRIQTVYFSNLDVEAYTTFWSQYCDEVAAVDYKNTVNREKGLKYDWACPQLWQRMTIEWDGTLIPCNNDDFRLLSSGNVNERTIYECWHADKVNKARALHKAGETHNIEACDGCPWRTAQIRKLQGG